MNKKFTGLTPPAYGLALATLEDCPLTVCVAKDTKTLTFWAEALLAYKEFIKNASASPLSSKNLWHYPKIISSEDSLPEEAVRVLSSLRKIHEEKEPVFLFATEEALYDACPSPESLQSTSLELIIGKDYPFDILKNQLGNELHYHSERVCEGPGQFAIRGGLIDVYPYGGTEPYRLDFFHHTLESIRPFDPTTQHSLPDQQLKSVFLPSIPKILTKEATLLDHLPNEFQVVAIESDGFSERWEQYLEKKHPRALYSFQLAPEENADADWSTAPLQDFSPQVQIQGVGDERLKLEAIARESLFKTLESFHQEKYKIVYFSPQQHDHLKPFFDKLEAEQFPLQVPEGVKISFNQKAPSALKAYSSGLIVVTDREIFNRYRLHAQPFQQKKVAEHSALQTHLNFEQLVEGDLLVHIQHGIARFKGFTVLDNNEKVLSLEFQNATLHTPLHEAHLLSRYVGLSKSIPKLSKLGSKSWQKIKTEAIDGIEDFAADLLRLQAVRTTHMGYAYPADSPLQYNFENAFEFPPTPDQLTASQAIKIDLEAARPMDRLLCGDVGFGKTEVAMRAAFKAAISGKQVAVLVPTTLLCEQHFQTFRERMYDFPLVIESLSRFKTPSERTKILAQVATGKIDILIGTHALLSDQIHYKDLGLVIIDEEHRFGVEQKEKLKRLRMDVDVLSMSATPIPRTLYMALVGARDLSTLETPPKNRLPIETSVQSFNEHVLKQALEREIQRGGQVFYLHGRVQSIQKVANFLQKLVPEARIAIGHGQMPGKDLETIMTDFVHGKYDILVATTIIESGIDVPNANTLIVDYAERFGLAQLYQIRGRVGRFDRQAYAYFFLGPFRSKGEPLFGSDAYKRLNVLAQNNQLGAGLRIAMRDLELRGAGNLLGAQQSGHIAAIGFDLYCDLLRKSVDRLQGASKDALPMTTIHLDFMPLGEHVSVKSPTDGAYIPEAYMPELRNRVETYRQIAHLENINSLEAFRKSLEDRYGKLPLPCETLLKITALKFKAQAKKVIKLETQNDRLMIELASGYWKIGPHFPRLKSLDPLKKLEEIFNWLKQL